jgi:CRISPR/Cas system type I-B associated protein Csh2 (Cas7 group RAMP superfamily)
MRRFIAAMGSLVLMTTLSLGVLAQDSAPAKPAATAKPAKAAAPKTDAEIQQCLTDKFAVSKTIKNGAAMVSDGVATLTGEATSGATKGGATRSAKACGAKSVVNNITAPPKAKPAEKKA